jgi:hypothetical protein
MKIVRPSRKAIRTKKTKRVSRSTLDKNNVNEKLHVFMSNVGNIIVNDSIDMPAPKALIAHGIKPDNITEISRKTDSITGMYFVFQDSQSLDMFKKSILAMSKEFETIKIATTFSTDKISEPAIYNACLDIMESSFPDHFIISQCSYAYSIRRGLIMHHQHFTLQKKY